MYLIEIIKRELKPSEILNLANARHKKGITQAELAKLAGINVSYLSKIENGACQQLKKTVWNKLFELIENFEEPKELKGNILHRNLLACVQKLEQRIEELEKSTNNQPTNE